MNAETEQDMRDWVMVICQVCNLQETEEKNGADSSTVQCKKVNEISQNFIDDNWRLFLDYNVGPIAEGFEAKEIPQSDLSGVTETTNLEPSSLSSRFDQLSIVNEYENDNVVTYRQSDYSNRETLVVGREVQNNNNQEPGLNYSNLPPMERAQSSASRVSTQAKSTGAIKKIPENLKLRSDDKINNNSEDISLAYRASGPYIPLSDCFSGSPVLFVS